MASVTVSSYVAVVCYFGFGIMLLVSICSVFSKLWRDTAPNASNAAPEAVWGVDIERDANGEVVYTEYREATAANAERPSESQSQRGRQSSQRLLHLASWREHVQNQSAHDLKMLQQGKPQRRLKSPSLDLTEDRRSQVHKQKIEEGDAEVDVETEPEEEITVEDIGAIAVEVEDDDESLSSPSTASNASPLPRP